MIRPLTGVTMLAMLFAGAAWALGGEPTQWTVTTVHGLAVYLSDGKWEEVTPRVVLVEPTLMTLRASTLTLEHAGAELQIGTTSAVQLSTREGASGTTIRHYFGELAIAIPHDASTSIIVVASCVIVSNIEGEVALTMDDSNKRVEVVVRSGRASVRAHDQDFVSESGGRLVTC